MKCPGTNTCARNSKRTFIVTQDGKYHCASGWLDTDRVVARWPAVCSVEWSALYAGDLRVYHAGWWAPGLARPQSGRFMAGRVPV